MFICELKKDLIQELEKDVRKYYEVVGIDYSDEWKNEKLLNIMDLSDTSIECGLTWSKYSKLIRGSEV